jgi:glycosyltransferase involved in cell wall biosynthesis
VDFLLIARENKRSTNANFPSKIPESMCYGVIPIVSKVGDYSNYYLTDGKDSIMFNDCTADDCAKAISKAINLTFEERTKMSANSRKCAIEKFYYKNWADALCNYINSLSDVK